MLGTVTAFDDPAGIGQITGADGRVYPFHCTQLADGTRTTTVGTPVAFHRWPRLGVFEAAGILPTRTG
jgi:CspA family cold shock protein